MNAIMKKALPGVTAALLVMIGLPVAALAAPVTIQVNGSTVSFDQPPIERGGRVYVPLRGVFERLGASVVYANRAINATGNGHNINLTIGSSTATVDGSSVGLDSPPFLVGSRTLVPLRFVAQALGATVNYNSSNRVVAINSGGGGANTGGGNTGSNPPPASVTLLSLNPPNGGVVSASSPTLTGTFSAPVDPNSVHVSLDGRDITTFGTYVNANQFQITTPNLPASAHTVTITGNAAAGGAFSQSFSFTSGADTRRPFVANVRVNGIAIVNGMQVPNAPYAITGSTTPGATVQIITSYQTSIFNGLIPLGGNTNSQTVQADSAGRFAATIDPSIIGSPAQYVIGIRSINRVTQATSTPVQYTVHT
ncbi:MAG: hypothetical protein DLM50_02505 [Candidatus Meridianibacter frigidus]|nr:MAG: hypothetical protein DLM50_02505 [Candidatus Eremiobacteraeota bacterium]